MATIHKSAGVIISNRKLLVSRSHGKDYFIAPGGKLEPGETATRALVRELHEEQGIIVSEPDLAFFGSFKALAKGHEAEQVELIMDVYIVKAFAGTLTPGSEIAENLWIASADADSLNLGSIFAHDVIPGLKEQDLID
jgi:8-oxo-dGTP diphosphatase